MPHLKESLKTGAQSVRESFNEAVSNVGAAVTSFGRSADAFRQKAEDSFKEGLAAFDAFENRSHFVERHSQPIFNAALAAYRWQNKPEGNVMLKRIAYGTMIGVAHAAKFAEQRTQQTAPLDISALNRNDRDEARLARIIEGTLKAHPTLQKILPTPSYPRSLS